MPQQFFRFFLADLQHVKGYQVDYPSQAAGKVVGELEEFESKWT